MSAGALTPASAEIPPGPVPGELPDDSLYEVVGGKKIEKDMGVYEAALASLIHRILGTYVATHGLGRCFAEMIFRIDVASDLQRRPDVSFVSAGRWALDRKLPRVAAWDLAPDLAIEVVSPTNSANPVVDKIQEYFDAGVGRIWVVYPSQAKVYDYASPTQVRVIQAGEAIDGGALLPGFRLPLETLFEDQAD